MDDEEGSSSNSNSEDRHGASDNLDHYGAATLRSLLNSSDADHPNGYSDEIPLEEIWKPKMDVKLELDYRMDRPRRGKAIIFNHFLFAIPGMAPRGGTDLDEDSFCQILLTWGFRPSDIVLVRDATYTAIMDRLYDLSKHQNYDDYDAFVCAVFSHGERNSLYSRDQLFPTSEMWKYFTDAECPSLKGKPKLFFIQACRGTELDAGVDVQDPKLVREKLSHLTIDAKDGATPETEMSSNSGEKSPEEILVITSNDKNVLDSIVDPEGDESPIADTQVDGKLIDEGPRKGSRGSIHSMPPSWLNERRNSADDLIPFVKDKSFWLSRKRRSRGASEGEGDADAMLLDVPHTNRRSSAPIKVPQKWLESQTEVMDSKWIEQKEPFQAPHDDPDILVAFSTADGYYSFRRPSHGSWFINVLGDVVKRVESRSDDVNLLDLLTEVNLRVAVELESYVNDPLKRAYNKKKQISCFHSTLTKRLYFSKK